MPESNSSFSERGVVHILPLILVVVVIVVFVGFLLIKGGVIKTRVSKDVEIQLASKYENPFDKSTQYVNPFSEYKNPFDNLK